VTLNHVTTEKDSQASYYNERFGTFEHANTLQLERAAHILSALHSFELDKPRILDFGCGPGWLSNILSTFGPTVGIDLSPQAIADAKKRYLGPQFDAVDVFRWEYIPKSFDVVVSQEVIEHVEDQPRYIEMISELLTDRGLLILTVPNASAMMAMPEADRIAWSNQPIEHWLTVSELRSLLEKRFDLLSTKTITLGMGSLGTHRIINSAKLVKLLAGVGLGPGYDWFRGKFGFGLHIVATARKR
jgi:2-polyprenyl-3-methyl-5-hydroxy-6-metoxy-1,4-benzoquinol methylase